MFATNTGNFSDHLLGVVLGAFSMGYLQEQMREIISLIVVAERFSEVDPLSRLCCVVTEIDALEIIEIMFVRVKVVGQGVGAFRPEVGNVGNPDELRGVEEKTDEEDNVLSRPVTLLVEDTLVLELFRREELCPVGTQERADFEELGHIAWPTDVGHAPGRVSWVGIVSFDPISS